MRGQELEIAFLDRGVVRGGILFLRAVDAIALVEAARERNIRVLGVDGFRLESDFTQPLMEHSIDVSSAEAVETWTAATRFIRQQVGDLFFEVVMDS